MLAVICGSLHVADQMILRSFQHFQSTLERCVVNVVVRLEFNTSDTT